MSRLLFGAVDSHPGKLIGTSVGFLFGLLIVTLGFWRTLIVALCAVSGFVAGKRQDDDQSITAWLERMIKRY